VAPPQGPPKLLLPHIIDFRAASRASSRSNTATRWTSLMVFGPSGFRRSCQLSLLRSATSLIMHFSRGCSQIKMVSEQGQCFGKGDLLLVLCVCWYLINLRGGLAPERQKIRRYLDLPRTEQKMACRGREMWNSVNAVKTVNSRGL
jgi:hypothetical protein